MGGRGSRSFSIRRYSSGVLKASLEVRSSYTNGSPFDEGEVGRLFDEAVSEGRIRFESEKRLSDRNLENDKFAIVALLNAGRNIVILMSEDGDSRHVDAIVDGVLYEIKSPVSDAYKKSNPSKVVYDNLDKARRQFRGDPKAAGSKTRVVFNGKHTTLTDDDISDAIKEYMKKDVRNQVVEVVQVKKDGTIEIH